MERPSLVGLTDRIWQHKFQHSPIKLVVQTTEPCQIVWIKLQATTSTKRRRACVQR